MVNITLVFLEVASCFLPSVQICLADFCYLWPFQSDLLPCCSCGQIQTGTFLSGAAPNGLFGLGMDSISVPSILARNGLASNSFSMCFGDDGMGRINFGNNGSSDQRETPFNIGQSQ